MKKVILSSIVVIVTLTLFAFKDQSHATKVPYVFEKEVSEVMDSPLAQIKKEEGPKTKIKSFTQVLQKLQSKSSLELQDIKSEIREEIHKSSLISKANQTNLSHLDKVRLTQLLRQQDAINSILAQRLLKEI